MNYEFYQKKKKNKLVQDAYRSELFGGNSRTQNIIDISYEDQNRVAQVRIESINKGTLFKGLVNLGIRRSLSNFSNPILILVRGEDGGLRFWAQFPFLITNPIRFSFRT